MRIVIEHKEYNEKFKPIAAHMAVETAVAMRQPVLLRFHTKSVLVMPWHKEHEIIEEIEA